MAEEHDQTNDGDKGLTITIAEVDEKSLQKSPNFILNSLEDGHWVA